jgi:hypothetical protein
VQNRHPERPSPTPTALVQPRLSVKLGRCCPTPPWSSYPSNLRQQVGGWLNFRGILFQRPPFLSKNRIPFDICRSSVRGLPILPWAGIRGRITSHRSSANSTSMAESTSAVLRPELNLHFRLLQLPQYSHLFSSGPSSNKWSICWCSGAAPQIRH